LLPTSSIRFPSYTNSFYSSSYVPVVLYDSQRPEIDNCPSDIVVSSDSFPDPFNVDVTYSNPTAHDNFNLKSFEVSGNGRVDVPVLPDTNLGPFPVGTTEMMYIARDDYGNTAVCSFTITVIDTTRPFIECHAPVSSTLSANASVVTFKISDLEPIKSTYLDNDRNKSYGVNVVSYSYGYGNHVVSRIVTDPSGNDYTCQTAIFVDDITSPQIVGCPTSDVIAYSGNSVDASTTWGKVSCTDNSGACSFTKSPQLGSGSTFPIGTTLIEYVATDAAGLTASCSFNVQVNLPSSSLSSSSGSSTSASTIIIASSVSGGVFLLIIILVSIAFVRLRRRAQQKPHNFDGLVATLTDIEVEGGHRVPRELKRPQVKIIEAIGKGNFGEVSKGVLTENPNVPGYLVAIKSLLATFDADRGEILREAAIMAQFVHPYVIGLVGVVTIGEPLLVVIEYCEHGSLNKYLEKHEVDLKTKYMLAADCAEGLAYLSSLKFVHRDIAARNVLVSSERRAKISDFGMSRETSDSAYYHSKGGQLPVRWTAPEALEDRKFSEQSDVWSFGVLMYEIWTKAALPYKDMNNQKVWVAVLGGYRLSCPEGCPVEVHKLMLRCWTEPHERPRFTELGEQLRSFEGGKTLEQHRRASRRESTNNNSAANGHMYVDFTQKSHHVALANPAYSQSVPENGSQFNYEAPRSMPGDASPQFNYEAPRRSTLDALVVSTSSVSAANNHYIEPLVTLRRNPSREGDIDTEASLEQPEGFGDTPYLDIVKS
jgi:serine/threonine protein kinase